MIRCRCLSAAFITRSGHRPKLLPIRPLDRSIQRTSVSNMTMPAVPEKQLAIQILEPGPVEQIKLNEIPVERPGKDQVLVKVEWSGINYIDTYFRSGLYPVKYPFTLGNEPAGEIVALGPNLTDQPSGLKIGDKVVTYFRGGGLQQYTLCEASKTYKIPDDVSTKDAACLLLQGLTALTFVNEAYKAKKGDHILVHAAAGGLGLMLCQMLSNAGVVVIGTTSSEEKAKLAKESGATHVVLYGHRSLDEVVVEIKKLTPAGEGVDAVFDGVGKDTWESNFQVLKRKGSIVSFGNASGPAPEFSPLKLMPKNLKLCRPMLDNYVFTGEEFQTYSEELFGLLKKNVIKTHLYKDEGYPFTAAGVQDAHRDITSRKTNGKLVVKVA